MLKHIIYYLKARFSKQEGMEMLQVILIAGLVLVLIATVFYDKMEYFLTTMLSTVTDWFINTGSKPFKASS